MKRNSSIRLPQDTIDMLDGSQQCFISSLSSHSTKVWVRCQSICPGNSGRHKVTHDSGPVMSRILAPETNEHEPLLCNRLESSLTKADGLILLNRGSSRLPRADCHDKCRPTAIVQPHSLQRFLAIRGFRAKPLCPF